MDTLRNMMSVLHPMLQTLHSTVRSRAALQLEVLALRHQLWIKRNNAVIRINDTGLIDAIVLTPHEGELRIELRETWRRC